MASYIPSMDYFSLVSSACIKMSIKEMVVVITFSVMAWKSLGLKWTTERLHTNCCEGQDMRLMWNYSLEENDTVQDNQWYFNHSTLLAYVSVSGKFYVHDLYKCRVEQISKMGILLKNVSSVDAGNYSLYLNLGPEPPENMQTIFLTVFESPTYQCKPRITTSSENVLLCSTNSCGGIQLSTEWRISEQYDFVSNESYLKINSSWNNEHVSCCLHRQCQNGNFLNFCESAFIFFAEDKHAPDSRDTKNSSDLTTAVIVSSLIMLLLSIVTFIFFICIKKRCRLCGRRHMDEILELVCLKGHETRSTMGGSSPETSATNLITGACSSLSEGGRRHMDEILELVYLKGHETHSTMGGSSPETSATNLMTGACSSLSEGAMQDKDAKIKLEANMEPEVFLLMRGRPSDAET